MRPITFALTSLVLLWTQCAHAQENRDCSTLPSTLEKRADITKLISAAKKGEFETTEAVKARLAAMLPNNAIAISVPNSTELTKYDADTETLTINRFSILVKGMMILDSSGGNHTYYQGSQIASDRRNTGSYLGQNAFGAKAKVSSIEENSLGVAWQPDKTGITPKTEIKLHMPLADAKMIKSRLAFLIEGTVAAPFVVSGSSYSGATIDDPISYTHNEKALVIEPSCAAVYDPVSGKIFQSWPAAADH